MRDRPGRQIIDAGFGDRLGAVECDAARRFDHQAPSPGVVLRVQHTRALVWAMRRTNSEAAVAMPERWPTKLSATRSAPSRACASPVMVMSAVFAATVAPSRTCPLISTAGSSLRNAAAAIGRPAITPALRATLTAVPRVPSRNLAIDVTPP